MREGLLSVGSLRCLFLVGFVDYIMGLGAQGSRTVMSRLVIVLGAYDVAYSPGQEF